ncbi:MAG: hypothetical protein RL518_776 [Pseudomonadota bacterium]
MMHIELRTLAISLSWFSIAYIRGALVNSSETVAITIDYMGENF